MYNIYIYKKSCIQHKTANGRKWVALSRPVYYGFAYHRVDFSPSVVIRTKKLVFYIYFSFFCIFLFFFLYIYFYY